MEVTVHNPDRYMGDLRQILAQGRKRIGVLLGAGGPASILVDEASGKLSKIGKPLIPTIAGLTQTVIEGLNGTDSAVVSDVCKDLGPSPNVEMILSCVRSLAALIGCNSIYGCNGAAFTQLSNRICESIGKAVGACLPEENNPYTELAGWIGGADRSHPIEVFTPNFDLLMRVATIGDGRFATSSDGD